MEQSHLQHISCVWNAVQSGERAKCMRLECLRSDFQKHILTWHGWKINELAGIRHALKRPCKKPQERHTVGKNIWYPSQVIPAVTWVGAFISNVNSASDWALLHLHPSLVIHQVAPQPHWSLLPPSLSLVTWLCFISSSTVPPEVYQRTEFALQ